MATYPQNFNHIPTILTPSATVAGGIEIYENVWSDCQNIIDNVEEICKDVDSGIHWQKATTLGFGAYQDHRTNFDLSITHSMDITGNQVMKNLHNRCNDLLVSAAHSYHTRFGIKESFWQEGYNLLKYQSGQEYKAHYDSNTGQGRHLTCILYLNSNYEGGEIEFPIFKIKIKPQTGMLMLFPSNFVYAHIAHPVKSGTKYAMVTWLHDRQN